MKWLSLCNRDPLLTMLESTSARHHVLARPPVGLRPLDVAYIVDEGWFDPPRLVRVGPLKALLRNPDYFDVTTVSGPLPNLDTTRSGEVTQKMAMDLLQRFVTPLGLAAPGGEHAYAGDDRYTVRLSKVEQHHADLVFLDRRGRACRLNMASPALRSAERRAQLVVIDSVLYAGGIHLEAVHRRSPSYRITFGESDALSWRYEVDDSTVASGQFERLPIAASCVRLIPQFDGSFSLGVGEHRVELSAGDPPRFGHLSVWPRGVLWEVSEEGDPGTTPPAPASAAPPTAPVMVGFSRMELGRHLSPGWDAGTTDLHGRDKRIGVAHVVRMQNGNAEYSVTDEAVSGLRSMEGSLRSARGADGGSGISFGGGEDFLDTAWSKLQREEGDPAIFLRSMNTDKTVGKLTAPELANKLVQKLQGVDYSVMRMSGTQRANPIVPSSGLVFFTEPVAIPNDEFEQQIFQVVPHSLGLPPLRAVELEPLGTDLAPAVRLQQLIDALDANDSMTFTVCNCVLRRVTHSWQLRNAPLPPPLNL